MEKLPEEFMLEEEYAMLEGEQQKEFDEMMKNLDPEILRRLKEGGGTARMEDGAGDEDVDSKKILDVLKQDLGGRL
jgi:succinate dehydrogenase flavin-adding protein (antitoxin of CptAB toxin-antitoxin module)